MGNFKSNRDFMKCSPNFRENMKSSDQSKSIEAPTYGKPITGKVTVLPAFDDVLTTPNYFDLLDKRRSVRKYDKERPMTTKELAFMLWSAAGIQFYRDKAQTATLRTVPSGGARHAFELYIAVKNVEGLEPGIYNYLPTENVGEKCVTIQYMCSFEGYETLETDMVSGQSWATNAAVTIFISCIPYLSEWRYTSDSHRLMLLDAGHMGQNIMLSAVALGLGTCCIGAYNQELCDETLGIDGENEFVVYIVPVGKEKA